MSPDAILGREDELAAIARFVSDDTSIPRALLLEGEAGIGKTTLWREGVRRSAVRGLTLESSASESETRLSFTVLGDLLAPVLDATIDELPAGRRRALEAALLLGPPTRSRPDARAVSLAVLDVVRSIAAQGAITIAIDDVQWTDAPSARALAFALRRLVDEPVTLIVARRGDANLRDPLDLASAVPFGVERLGVGPMDPAALGRLLRAKLGRNFVPPLVKRIHQGSGGNPLFALEIGRALSPSDPTIRSGEPLPVPTDLQALLRRRVGKLSEGSRQALLIAASCARPTTKFLDHADASEGGLEEAEEAGVVVVRDGDIRFTHPLLSSTVYGGASRRTRRAVHGQLAAVVTDVEERARHLALSIDGSDADAAAVLEDAASHAEARGAPLAAAELYQLAASVTPSDDIDRVQWCRQRSAMYLFAAGDVAGARALLERLLREAEAGTTRATVLYQNAVTSWNDVRRVTGFLVQALDEVGGDQVMRARVLGDLAWATLRSGDPGSAVPWADAAIELATEPVGLRSALGARAIAGFSLGDDTLALLERGIAAEGTLATAETGTPRTCLGWVQCWTGQLGAARETLEVELARYLEQGHESATWEVRTALAEVEYRSGRWDLAARHADDAREIAVDARWSEVLGEILPVKSAIEAATGDIGSARATGAEALSAFERTGDRWRELQARSALGFLELSIGDHAACDTWLRPASRCTEEMGVREPGVFSFVPDHVESLVALGQLEVAARSTDRLEEQAEALGRPLAVATAARCRGLIAAARREPLEAVGHLERALHEHRSVAQPFELGRTLLVTGQVWRRMRKHKVARDLLHQALDIFEEVGAPLWSARARSAIGRIGGRAPTSSALTPTEEQVAGLVGEGRTNREVAETLVMSVHTVDAHLRRIYRKLQIRSRTELARKL